MDLDTSVKQLPKIGPTYQRKLKKLGIETVRDLLFYFPQRYNDFSNVIKISQIKSGKNVCIKGEIIEIGTTRTFRKWMVITEATIQDESSQARAVWFNQPYIENSIKEGDLVCLAGRVTMGKGGVYLNNPAYETIEEMTENRSLTHTGRIVPVYSETKGLTSRWLRYVIKPLLASFYDKIPEILPDEILIKNKFLPVKKAIWQVHFPDSFESADAAKSRFSFEQLFLLQLSVLQEKEKLRQKSAQICQMDERLMRKFTKSLLFQLTDSQKKCVWQILKDLEKPFPMSRLLQGDVGSGKTVVAAMCSLNVINCGFQVAFMAPTEILAKQHFKIVSELLKNFHVKVGLLTGKESFLNGGKAKKRDLLRGLENGEVNIVIGTHALISKSVEFKGLALVVVDEQHRFGVAQRAELVKNKKSVPHFLSMTATPIPRTLALTVYGDLDLSLITEMPGDRKKIKTFVVDFKNRKKAYEFIKKEARDGKGVFVICPRIETKNHQSEQGRLWSDVKSVKQEYEKLSGEIFPDLQIAFLHGKMKPKEKEKIMADFRDGKTDILVSTSVVEVGIDVPRATIMMIEGAERFGLAQLHQFRGRVGRAGTQSYCFLFATEPNQQNRKRLRAMEKLDNGFDLAQKDLEIRGPGQIYGSQQWGLPDIAMQSIFNIFLVEKTRRAAKEILENSSGLEKYPLLKEQVAKFKTRIHFE